MFNDKRSKSVVLVAHCILNQNTKLDRCAFYPGAITETAHFLVDSGVGIVQMSCPEMMALGLARQAAPGSNNTVGEEDTRIADLMQAEHGCSICKQIVSDLMDQILEYQRNGFEILGLIGVNGSPTCGVEVSWENNAEKYEKGTLIKMFSEELDRQGISFPMTGIRAIDPKNALENIKKILSIPSSEE